jgi:hypothetical protein
VLVALDAILLLLWCQARFTARRRRLLARAVGVALAAATAVSIPSSTTLWASFHGSSPRQAIVREDETGLTVIRTSDQGRSVFFVSGAGESSPASSPI